MKEIIINKTKPNKLEQNKTMKQTNISKRAKVKTQGTHIEKETHMHIHTDPIKAQNQKS